MSDQACAGLSVNDVDVHDDDNGAGSTMSEAVGDCLEMEKGRKRKSKVKWTQEERRVLWRCFVETGGKKEWGYLGRMKDRWDRQGLSQRDKGSILIQL